MGMVESPTSQGEATTSNDSQDKEFVCPTCGKGGFDKRKHLSIHHTKSHNTPLDGEGYECDGCGSVYSTRRGLISHLRSNCPNTGHPCETCGRTFPTQRGLNHHLSEVHDQNTHKKVSCERCGKTKRLEPWHEERYENHFCSPECENAWRSETYSRDNTPGWDSGKNAPMWKGGHLNYYGPNWRRQRKKARERDSYTCQYCGNDMGGDERDPDVHHIKRLKWYKENYDEPEWYEKGNRLENLITACRSCHAKWEGIPVIPES